MSAANLRTGDVVDPVICMPTEVCVFSRIDSSWLSGLIIRRPMPSSREAIAFEVDLRLHGIDRSGQRPDTLFTGVGRRFDSLFQLVHF